MDRRSFLRLCAGGLAGASFGVLPGAACADSYQKSVVSQLRRQGYRQINVERTLLGRVRIVAARGGGLREIILNPRTGEILRDVLLAADGQVMPEIAGGDNSGKGSSGDDGSDDDDGSDGDEGSDDGGSDDGGSDDGGSDDDGSDDDGSDDGSDDHGGSGHGGSGSGGSGSGGDGDDD
ncbi:hypothetical protein GCM10010873_06290 [Cypionkella aquatica]|uniref:PepSY domain-containing protein n=1 Tax=Cypionkella aquatica TaxID=1756042 RepID=A0AA37X1Y5_9RHOB|nr:hypothetical protein [Cypionkella aquatica]GLS85656.1 hypothetical protein GCM10010873_06290 [Cypionkella aquatica]